MAWKGIPNNPHWQYDDAPADPGANSPYRPLWLKQTEGIRTNSGGNEVYTKVRKVGITVDTMGELSKTFWDAQGDEVLGTDAFELLIETNAGNKSMVLGGRSGYTYNAVVDWGDGTSTTSVTHHADAVHTYVTAGEYTISITGTFPAIKMYNEPSAAYIRKVSNLGKVGWKSFRNGFYACTGMTEFTMGNTDTSGVTETQNMFRGCSGLVGTLDLTSMIGSNCVNTTAMIRECSSVTSVVFTGWDTSSLPRFKDMMHNCTALVNVTGIEDWNITGVNVADAFSQILTNGRMTTAQYDALLVNWDAQSPLPQTGGTSRFGNSTYTSGSAAETSRTNLINEGWTISDGGSV